MKVIELIAVPTIESPIAQPGMRRPPTKYSSVSRLRRAKYAPIAAMPAR
ncbi:MAG: hypothetical protein R3E53_14890 [Myxococcota bacterium]